MNLDEDEDEIDELEEELDEMDDDQISYDEGVDDGRKYSFLIRHLGHS